jgi:hypothetical protein
LGKTVEASFHVADIYLASISVFYSMGEYSKEKEAPLEKIT